MAKKRRKKRKELADSVENPGWFTKTLNWAGLHTGSQVEFFKMAVNEMRDEFKYATDTSTGDFWNPDKPGPTKTDQLKATHHSPWFYAAVFMTANTIAQLPYRFTIEETDENGEIKEVEPEQPPRLAELFKYPDPVTKSSWYNLIEATCQYLEASGNAYWLIFHDKKYVKTSRGVVRLRKADDEFEANTDVFRIRLLRPDKVKPIKEKATGGLKGWAYKPGRGKATTYDINEVVHFDYFNTMDDFQGLSPATPAWDSIEALKNFDRLNRILIERDFEFGAVIEPEKDAEITPAQSQALANKLTQRHSGPNKANKPFAVPPGVKIKTLVDPKDLQFEELQRVMIRNVSAATGVPGALLGMTDQYNRANMKAIRKAFYKDTIMPKTRRIAEKIVSHLVPIFDPDLEEQDLKFKFDFSAVEALKEDPKDIALATKAAVGRAWKTVNEARKEMGLPAREEDPSADELYVKPLPGMAPIMGEGEEEAEKIDTSTVEWFDPLDHIDWKRASDDPVGFKIWKRMRKALAPIEESIIIEIHKRGKHDEDEVIEELHRQWHDLEERGVLEKTGTYRAYFRKAGPIMPKHEFDRMFGELEKHLEDQDAWMFEAIAPGVESSMVAGAELNAGTLEMGFDFDLLNPDIDLYKSRMADRITFEIADTTLNTFKASMYKGYELGEGIKELSERVMDNLGGLFGKKDWRAELIARTETTGAFNFGAYESYRQAKVDGTKHWISAFDDRVREWHIDVQSVKGNDTPFTVYGPSGPASMMYPGDSAGGAEQVCNCRCAVSLTPSGY